MSNRYRSNPLHPVAAPDDDVTRYETLPLEQVQEELRVAGIDPAPTIAAVRKLIEDSLAKAKPAAANSGPPPFGASAHRRPFIPAAHHEDAPGDDY